MIIWRSSQDTLKDMRSVQEMYARGFEFVPIDLKVAQANKFTILWKTDPDKTNLVETED
jgi:DNA polymerase III alpha subunit (gram-positive type)